MITWAIIPVKPLQESKSRLSHLLSPAERSELTSGMLIRTLRALHQTRSIHRTLVVSHDSAVLKLARRHGATSFNEGARRGLNVAVSRATQVVSLRGAAAVLILPADLPFVAADDVGLFVRARPEVTQESLMIVCPDHDNAGTNALLLAPPLPFTFHFGPGSYDEHRREGQLRGRTVLTLRVPGFQFDLDTERDWRTYQLIQRQIAARPLSTNP